MQQSLKFGRLALLSCTALAFLSSSAAADQKAAPPNWRGQGVGATAPDPNIAGVDRDTFVAQSSHLGKLVGKGFHSITGFIFSDTTLIGFTFEGSATWTAANGDALNVSYAGDISFTADPDYPFAFIADLEATGGTGRFAAAKGNGVMQGAFTGVPGEFYFSFEGTLKLKGK